jgi:hypothetical protein
VFGLHLTASSVSSATRRLVPSRLGERFAFRFGSDHVANLSQNLNARREEIASTVDDRGKLLFESGGDCKVAVIGLHCTDTHMRRDCLMEASVCVAVEAQIK